LLDLWLELLKQVIGVAQDMTLAHLMLHAHLIGHRFFERSLKVDKVMVILSRLAVRMAIT
jgi:hypothetical protein